MTPRQHIIVCDVVPLAITLIAMAIPLVFWDRLPEPLAAHWNGAGRPDGELGRAPLLLVIGGVGAGGSAMARLIGAQGVIPVPLRLSYCMAALTMWVSALTVWANLSAVTRQAARPLNVAVWLPVIIGAVVAGLGIGWLLEEGVDLPGPDGNGYRSKR